MCPANFIVCLSCRFADGYRRHTGTWPQSPGLQIPGWCPCVPLSPLQFLTTTATGLDVSGVCGDVPRWVTLIFPMLEAYVQKITCCKAHTSVFTEAWEGKAHPPFESRCSYFIGATLCGVAVCSEDESTYSRPLFSPIYCPPFTVA